MATVNEVYNDIDFFAPFNTQAEWDNSGLLVGDANAEVTKITISDLALGEYRLYTAMPDGTYTATKAYIYDFIITPKS